MQISESLFKSLVKLYTKYQNLIVLLVMNYTLNWFEWVFFLKVLLNENENLRTQLNRLQDQNDNSKITDKARKGMLEQLNIRLAQNIQELRSIQQEFTALLSASWFCGQILKIFI